MPFHSKRRWRVEKVSTAEELAENLTGMSQTTCQGFQCQDLIWLNDSTGPDGNQVWAVVRQGTLTQLELVDVGCALKKDDVDNIVQQQNRFCGGKGKGGWGRDYDIPKTAFDHGDECHHCA